jgi:integrase
VKGADGKVVLDDKGEPVRKAKYTGLHALHISSLRGVSTATRTEHSNYQPPKVVHERLGHASITMSMDVYGHLIHPSP